ncbi:MAG TPA: PEP-CTERM sorting domain-containing protein [Candidatus Acidoferrales bacterium]|nr:PEP-CTERM sorting domain-containing protein [Candidatus Acidoferrales bacterium]
MFAGFLLAGEAAADPAVIFDFNSLPPGLQSAPGADSIESYMEGLYGADISVDTGAYTSNSGIKVKKKFAHLGNTDGALYAAKLNKKQLKLRASDTFLANPATVKGAKSYLALDFGSKPISGLEFDFEIFPVRKKFPAGLTVKADGVTILEYSASKKDKKTGLLGHQSLLLFDTPVHKLEFIGTPNTPIGIDNLLVYNPAWGGSNGLGLSAGSGFVGAIAGNNLPSESEPPNGGEGPLDYSGTAWVVDSPQALQEVPEPSALFLIGAGVAAIALTRLRLRP